jgi:hypothetical protein
VADEIDDLVVEVERQFQLGMAAREGGEHRAEMHHSKAHRRG